MLSGKTNSENDKIFILLAPGFEEGSILYCLANMREAGLPVSLVGLSSGMVRGQHGLMVRPDQSLAQVNPAQARMVLFPGGRQCLASLAADPRVHHLLQTTLCNNGYVIAAMKSPSLANANGFNALVEKGRFINQEEQQIEAFAEQLIDFARG